MEYILEGFAPKTYEGDLIFLYGDEGSGRRLPLSKRELDYINARRVKEEEGAKDFVMTIDRFPHKLFFVSFDSEKSPSDVQEGLRRSAGEVLHLLEPSAAKEVALSGEGVLEEEMAAFLEGLTLADYSFDHYKNKPSYHLHKVMIDKTFFAHEEQLRAQERMWKRIELCREWVNMPVADFNAEHFASELQREAKATGKVSCTVLGREEIERLAMGGLLAVNRGSVDDPRFVILEYDGRPEAEKKGAPAKGLKRSAKGKEAEQGPIVLVGKGVTYDTGGLNIKPDEHMQEMKTDMAGAATMACVLFAAADNDLPVHLVALLPMTDNRPGANAYAPDDILRMFDGTTVEIVNTDAEGRLILADAIAYGVKHFQPRIVITAATLTGAALRALSTYGIAAMQQGAERDIELLKTLGNEVYERIVEFPLWKEYKPLLKSQFADLRNCATTPNAGMSTAALFLAHFAHGVPFLHLDIAPVAYFPEGQHFFRPGASAYGLRLLYAYLQVQS